MLTLERQRALAHANENPAPEWVRVPGAIRACGLKKTRLYELLNEARGESRTIVLKSPGAERGARLIHLPSLLRYLDAVAEEQEGLKR